VASLLTAVGCSTEKVDSLLSTTANKASLEEVPDTPPTLTITPGTTSYAEGSPPVVIDPGLSLTDPDGPNLTGVSVSLSAGYVPDEDRLGFTAAGERHRLVQHHRRPHADGVRSGGDL
jgi:hypothetical protein